jgi:hypothetical protein
MLCNANKEYLSDGSRGGRLGSRLRPGCGQAGHLGTRLRGPMFMTPLGSCTRPDRWSCFMWRQIRTANENSL